MFLQAITQMRKEFEESQTMAAKAKRLAEEAEAARVKANEAIKAAEEAASKADIAAKEAASEETEEEVVEEVVEETIEETEEETVSKEEFLKAMRDMAEGVFKEAINSNLKDLVMQAAEEVIERKLNEPAPEPQPVTGKGKVKGKNKK